MTERFKVTVLKTVEVKASESSNLSLSANINTTCNRVVFILAEYSKQTALLAKMVVGFMFVRLDIQKELDQQQLCAQQGYFHQSISKASLFRRRLRQVATSRAA